MLDTDFKNRTVGICLNTVARKPLDYQARYCFGISGIPDNRIPVFCFGILGIPEFRIAV